MVSEIYVSHNGGVSVFSPCGERLRSTTLAGAGALCCCGERLLCAMDEGDTILNINRRTLMQETVFRGGPGICQLQISPDEKLLYALCAEADSVWLMDARSGVPKVVCRVGCNPRQMALCGSVLAIAGGESGSVHLMNAQSLEVYTHLSMLGPVYSVAMTGERIHALCLTQTLNTLLVTDTAGERSQLLLEGMPGRILCRREVLIVSSHGRLYTITPDGRRILRVCPAPGRSGTLLAAQGDGRVYSVDMLSERLFLREREGTWRSVCLGAKDAVCVPHLKI